MDLRNKLLLLALLAPATGRAEEVAPISADEASSVAGEVDADLAKMRRDLDAVSAGYGAPVAAEVGKVERRLREGEIHYLLNDYLRASIVLLDVVDDEAQKSHPRYDDCLFLLAQALWRSKNLGGARVYFEELLPRAKGDRLKDVVLALLEISAATDRYQDVERYIGRLREAGTLSRPDVDYIYGKMLFRGASGDPGRLQQAHDTFKAIPTGNSVSPQAAYYAGVALVKLGRFEDAIRQFHETLGRISGSGLESKQLRELTQLSLGRLYQEIGDVSKSSDAYQEIPQSSPYFGETLYEVAWTYVRSANLATDPEEKKKGFVRGLRATELLMATAPDSRLYPQARLLQGNLQIRLEATESAYETFETIISRYGTANAKLQEILSAHPDTKQFFDQLVATDLGQVGSATILPPVALSWALDEPEMSRAVSMNSDLAASRKYIEESRELVRGLSEALEGEGRFSMFPGIGPARAKALSVDNRLVNLNRRLINTERRMVWPHLAATDRATLDQAHARAAALEAEVQSLPQSEEEIESSKGEIKAEYQATGHRAYRQTYQVSSMRAQVVAIERWLNESRESMGPSEVQALETELDVARSAVRSLEQELEALQGDIRTAELVASADGGSLRSQHVRDAYGSVLTQEIALLRSLRDRIPGEAAAVCQRFDQQRAAMGAMSAELNQLQSSLEAQVNRRVHELRAAIAAEAERLNRYEGEHGELRGTTDQLLGPVAARTLTAVGDQFKQFVLQADVGIIDVAWARKQAETKKVNELIKQQQARTSELESDFADVLEE